MISIGGTPLAAAYLGGLPLSAIYVGMQRVYGGSVVPPAEWYPTDLGSRLEALWDCNDHSTLFQDDAGTLPVTGILQPVGLMLDKSGHERHLQQITAASRPELRAHPKAYGETIFALDEFDVALGGWAATGLSFGGIDSSKAYELEFTVGPYSSGELHFPNSGAGAHQLPFCTGAGAYRGIIWKSLSGRVNVSTRGTGFYGTLRNIKVREITEWHNHYLYFDGVDDFMIDQGQWAQAVPFPMAHAIAFLQDPTSGTGNINIFERGASHLRHQLQLQTSSGQHVFAAAGGTAVSVPGFARDDVTRRVIANPHLGASKIRVNGADTEWNNSGGYALQTMSHAPAGGSRYKGAIYTHAVFTGSMTPEEFDTVDDWLYRRSNPSAGEWTPFNLGDRLKVWWDPSDLSTLYQDDLGTLPVSAVGDPVGLMKDKSGNGNHATQATAAARPLWSTLEGQPALAFDGVDDGIGRILTQGLPKRPATVALGFKVDVTTPVSSRVRSRPLSGVVGGDNYYHDIHHHLRGDGTGEVYYGFGTTTAPQEIAGDDVGPYAVVGEVTGSAIVTTINGNSVAVDSTATREINSVGLGMTARGENQLNGRITQTLVIQGLLDPLEKTQLQQWLAAKTGVALS